MGFTCECYEKYDQKEEAQAFAHQNYLQFEAFLPAAIAAA
jgi:viroplasmin and RNaseH domain-containing protein